jgi:RsiW-degrading membrane proteinase PrsW (M82 family)
VLRAVFSVPGHALFGVFMGYYFTMAKFNPNRRKFYILLAFTGAWLLHGVYNFILLSGSNYYMAIFVLFSYVMWRGGLRKIKTHLNNSPFKPAM